MNGTRLEEVVALGLGRAVIYFLNHDARPYYEIILDACLHNKAYDLQVEGGRAVYLKDLMRASGDQPLFEGAVVNSLSQEADAGDATQRFQLARLLAQDGNQNARRAMKEAFRDKAVSSSEVALEFIELDGIAGLLFVAGRIGESLKKNPRQWEDDYLLSVAGDICGREVVEIALTESAGTDSNVRAYLAAVNENQALRALKNKHNQKVLPYEEIRVLIETNEASGALRKWAETASDNDMMLAAHDLVQETDPIKLRRYLTLFRNRPFPLDLNRLLKLVELPDGPIPRHALSVLANIEDARIRSLAFRLIETRSTMRGYAIDLLVHNFRSGDHSTVESWCDGEQDPGATNAFDRSCRRFFARHPEPEREARVLTNFYEKEPCAHCRCAIIERLLALNGLSDALRRECEYDSYADTRALFHHWPTN
jgi:hypothetical protein